MSGSAAALIPSDSVRRRTSLDTQPPQLHLANCPQYRAQEPEEGAVVERKWSDNFAETPPLKKHNTLRGTSSSNGDSSMGLQKPAQRQATNMMGMTMNSSAPTKTSQTASSVGMMTMRSLNADEHNQNDASIEELKFGSSLQGRLL